MSEILRYILRKRALRLYLFRNQLFNTLNV